MKCPVSGRSLTILAGQTLQGVGLGRDTGGVALPTVQEGTKALAQWHPRCTPNPTKITDTWMVHQ
jgi:hypothetical protein